MRQTITCLVANLFIFFPTGSSLSQTLPPPPPQENSVEYEFEAPSYSSPSPPESSPPNNSNNSNANTLFRVQIYGTSKRVLSLVRRVEPEAFVPEGENIIQAGLFSERSRARSLVEDLSQQGVQADIIRIQNSQSRSSSSRETISLSSAASTSSEDRNETAIADSSQNQTENEKKSRAYYVVIPGNEKQVSTMAQKAQQAGVNSDLIQQRDAPRGTHVAVGPFETRHEASRWNEQLQSEGLDRARVYFGR